MEEISAEAFMQRIEGSFGPRGSHTFRPLRDQESMALFEGLLDALLAGELPVAHEQIAQLHERGVHYGLARVSLGAGGEVALGFFERVAPGAEGYRGWGAGLVRVGGPCATVYQAPHVRADEWSEAITLRAFADDPGGCVALFAGTDRYANGDGPAFADVAHQTDNLFHALTASLARRAQRTGTPRWFVQIHGSADRQSEPIITASDGAAEPQHTPGSPLVRIHDQMERAGYDMVGVCGWREGRGRLRDGRYLLCARTNLQGALLEELGQRHAFMHFELARTLRDDYAARRAPGYGAVLELLRAIRETNN